MTERGRDDGMYDRMNDYTPPRLVIPIAAQRNRGISTSVEMTNRGRDDEQPVIQIEAERNKRIS